MVGGRSVEDINKRKTAVGKCAWHAAHTLDINMARHTAPGASPTLLSRWEALLSKVPSQCAVCHAWPAQRICHACVARFAQPHNRCTACALQVPAGVNRCGACLLAPPPLDLCLAAVDYGYPWKQCIAQFKFQGDPGWALALAMLVRQTPDAADALDAADWVLPVPLATEGLRERGFNQALQLARQLAPHKVQPHLLLRLHATPAQHTLARAQRLQNLDGAFAVDPLHYQQLAGRRVVLVDDVMTTGATLHAAAVALRMAGTLHLTAMVIARTPGGN